MFMLDHTHDRRSVKQQTKLSCS